MNKQSPATGRRKVFYGWYIVAGATVASFVGLSVTQFGLPVMFKPMLAELGWSRTNFFTVQLVSAVISGLAAPFVGRRVDRSDPRLLVLVGTLLVGASVASYSRVHSLWVYLVLAGLVTPAGMALCGGAVYNAVIGKWFVKRRGRALVIGQVGNNLSSLIAPPGLVFLLAGIGWRTTWVVMGSVFVVLMLPMALMIRRSPEDVGLRPDGEALSPGTVREPSRISEPEWLWRQLLRTPTLWTIALFIGLANMAVTGTAFHQYAFFTDRGMAPAVAAATFSSVAVSGLALRPLWAYIYEHWDLRYAALLPLLSVAFGLAGWLATTNIAVVFSASVLRGVFAGGFGALPTMFCAHYFGRRNLGQVSGLAHLIGLPFVASGPTLAAWMYDRLHSYDVVFLAFVGMFAVSSGLVFLVRPPGARSAVVPGAHPGSP